MKRDGWRQLGILTSLLWILISNLSAQTKQSDPSLKATEQWMQNTLNNADSGALFVQLETRIEKRSWSMPSAVKCDVSFEYQTGEAAAAPGGFKKVAYDALWKFNLKDIDPTSIQLAHAGSDLIGPKSIISIATRDNANLITLEYPLGVSPENGAPTPSDSLVFEFGSPYAERFTKAFKHAVVLCGGKSSTF
jgi:hypothetical protein